MSELPSPVGGGTKSIPAPPRGGEVAFQLSGWSKIYPGTVALDNVDLELTKGEVHALCGGNGSGKSTLIKILSGVVHGDAGTLHAEGKTIDVAHLRPKLVHSLGIRVVHQDLALFPDLTVAENMTLGDDAPTGVLGKYDWKTARRVAKEQIARFEIDARPNDMLRKLPVATRAQIAIARALRDIPPGRGLVILDEPTASLPVREAKLLHDVIVQLGKKGHTVLFVSHRLDEVLSLTDRVTVLRDGRVSATHRTSTLSEAELIESILGRRADEVQAHVHRTPSHGSPVLTVKGLTAGPLRGVTLELRAGEVVGVAGLLGSGRTELLRAICGDLRRQSGHVSLMGRPADFARIDQAISRGVVMIPEDRAAGGIFPSLSVNENMDVSVLRRYWRLLFRRKSLRRDAASLKELFKIKAASGSATITSLSGGNQQKTVLARWIRRNPTVLLLDEPTQGVDVGARVDIYAAVRRVTDAGGAALVVVSDLEELAQVVDRAIVLVDGRVTSEVPGSELSAQRLSELVYRGPGAPADQ